MSYNHSVIQVREQAIWVMLIDSNYNYKYQICNPDFNLLEDSSIRSVLIHDLLYK